MRWLLLAVAVSLGAHGLLAATLARTPPPRPLPAPAVEVQLIEVSAPPQAALPARQRPPRPMSKPPQRAAVRSAQSAGAHGEQQAASPRVRATEVAHGDAAAVAGFVERPAIGTLAGVACAEAGTARYFDAWELVHFPAPASVPVLALPEGELNFEVTVLGDGRVNGVVAVSQQSRPPPAEVLNALRALRFSPPVAHGERVTTTVQVTARGSSDGGVGWTREGLRWVLRVAR